MLIKTNPDAIQSYLYDASHMLEGEAERVVFPEKAEEVAEILREATDGKIPVTISGAGTGTVGGRIPFSGIVLATDKLNQIKSFVRNEQGGASAVVEAGVRLSDFQRFVDSQGMFYPPDPTERSCFVGGTIATNASGARTFKYGPTRNYVERLKVALATGEIIDLRRGELHADKNSFLRIPLPADAGGSDRSFIEARLPSYQMPQTRKHAAGYFVAPEMDLLDLFIGSEGTLGVILEAELKLLPKPEGLLSGVVFFSSEESLLEFVQEARRLSVTKDNLSGEAAGQLGALVEKALEVSSRRPVSSSSADNEIINAIDARALEYFDRESLGFLRQKYSTIPERAIGAIFFEQEINSADENAVMQSWLALLETYDALVDDSWFATNEPDQAGLREFRHALPVLMNEWFARHRQRKVSTDMSVPDEAFAGMMKFYQDALVNSGIRYTIFGHIGDNHVHVNILPRTDEEALQAREIYLRFVQRAVEVGGTISAEHGIGKLKREYLRLLYSEEQVSEMVALKRALDPACILGRGNIFSEGLLSDVDSSI
ncbi:MAG TPA: FAD-binding oxidoreductase [Pyrinomonadaceae bacterium]|nr:FAD-binding oxidoreductase [Pyrinomonadaceae bacterium]